MEATSGEALFNGQKIRHALANSGGSNHSIGYCPQADALDHFLTPIEHLTIYAHMRGIKLNEVEQLVRESIEKFQLQPHASMPVQALSRGNRRKLCLAIAMLGNPQLILLVCALCFHLSSVLTFMLNRMSQQVAWTHKVVDSYVRTYRTLSEIVDPFC